MADVHDVTDEYFQRAVAWKKLKKGPKVKQRSQEFLREAQIMSGLEHPGIVATHALIKTEDDNLPALTMGKVSGMSLSEKIIEAKKDPNSWPLEERIQIIAKLAETLSYAHERQIVHRDIKPSNVMLGEYGEAFLMDWGLAKVLENNEDEDGVAILSKDQAAQMSMAGAIKGTPYYMSPEAARGKTEYVDSSSDIFSLGALFYEILTLNYFIKGSKTLEVLKNASESNYNDTSKEAVESFNNLGARKCDEELIYILEKCVDPVRLTRYKDAEQLKEHIYSYQNQLPIKGYEGGYAGYAFSKWMNRNGLKVVIFIIPLFLSLLYFSHLTSSKNDATKRKNELQSSIESLKINIKKISDKKESLEKSQQKLVNEKETLSKQVDNLEEITPTENSIIEENIKLGLKISNLKEDINEKNFTLLEKRDERIELQTEYEMRAGELIEEENKLNREKSSYEIEQICLLIQNIVRKYESGKQEDAKRALHKISRRMSHPFILRLLKNKWDRQKNNRSIRVLENFREVKSIPVAPFVEKPPKQFFDHEISSGYKPVKFNYENQKWLIFFLDSELRVLSVLKMLLVT
jgi:serine/threonine protein kinase